MRYGLDDEATIALEYMKQVLRVLRPPHDVCRAGLSEDFPFQSIFDVLFEFMAGVYDYRNTLGFLCLPQPAQEIFGITVRHEIISDDHGRTFFVSPA
jgi:hypothetical protein